MTKGQKLKKAKITNGQKDKIPKLIRPKLYRKKGKRSKRPKCQKDKRTKDQNS